NRIFIQKKEKLSSFSVLYGGSVFNLTLISSARK
ncbi:MAG: hypothetical protein ACI92E_000156, partial [Oceanicoccus sp.]